MSNSQSGFAPGSAQATKTPPTIHRADPTPSASQSASACPGWPHVGGRWADRYDILDQVGQGGSAVVFRALDSNTRREVALKVLRAAFNGWPEAMERFRREIAVMRMLAHSHLMPVTSSGEHAGNQFYTMPFLGYETLYTRQRRLPALEPLEMLATIRTIACALDHLHAHGFVHRDVKPANIILRESGAVLADFGCVTPVGSHDWPTITQTGCWLGTPQYMSPEQFWDPQRIAGACDQYSLACVAFELLSGSTPFSSGSPINIAGCHLSGTAPRLSSNSGAWTPAADRVFVRALAPDPAERFASVTSFAVALTAALT